MTDQTRNIITSACAMDPTIKPEDAKRGIAIIGGQVPQTNQDDRPVRLFEAAKMLNTSTRNFRRWVKTGIFRKVKVPGKNYTHGYVREDIENFRKGRLTPTTPAPKSTGNRRSPRRKAA